MWALQAVHLYGLWLVAGTLTWRFAWFVERQSLGFLLPASADAVMLCLFVTADTIHHIL